MYPQSTLKIWWLLRFKNLPCLSKSKHQSKTQSQTTKIINPSLSILPW